MQTKDNKTLLLLVGSNHAMVKESPDQVARKLRVAGANNNPGIQLNLSIGGDVTIGVRNFIAAVPADKVDELQ